MKYISTTFSPMMLTLGLTAIVTEVTFDDFLDLYHSDVYKSVIAHEVTAEIVSILLQCDVEFNRTNVTLQEDDSLLVITPNFRTNESREFTYQEVESAGMRCFKVQVVAI